MHIIGKILEENHNNFLTLMSSVPNGNLEHLFKFTEMDVKMNFYVLLVMVGKNKNIIQNNYKLNACRNDVQCTKAHCPYFHSDAQKRSQIPEGFKIHPKNRGCAFGTNEYLADFIQNQAPILLPKRSQIYHPSTAPFVNSDTFMKQPYYIIHASLGFKDQIQFSYYLTGHAEEQLDFKQRPVVEQKQNKMPRTLSHNSQMNANSSVPFYPGKGKVISKPAMQMPTYKNVDRRFPTSVSHGFLPGMNNQMQNMYAPPPGLEKPIMSQSNLYRAHMEEMNDNWNNHAYPQETVFPKSTSYMQQNASQNPMIPSALRTQAQPSFPAMRAKPMSTEFNYNFGSKLINENEDKFGIGYLENDSDSDGHEGDSFYPRFASKAEPL